MALRATGLCSFGGGPFGGEKLTDFLKAATGEDFPNERLEAIGERIKCMRQAFNLREGFIGHFRLPGRVIGVPPLETGPLAGITIDANGETLEYYETIGWDKKGRPSRERLEELGGFDKVIADLY
jgi:aldehyde:ferredoxin oxidoreductase